MPETQDNTEQAYGHVYLIRNILNNKVYIGQTTWTLKKRWAEHLKNARDASTRQHLANAIRKYGPHAFTIEEVDCAVNRAELDALEIKYIAQYDSMIPANGYNMTSGGEGVRDYKHTQEDRLIMSHASVAYWQDEEKCRQQRDRLARAWQDQEFRDKVLSKRAAIFSTQEWRKKNSEAQLRPDVVSRKSEATKRQWEVDGFVEEKRRQGKAQWEDPEMRAKIVAARNSPEAMERFIASQKRLYADPEYKAWRIKRLSEGKAAKKAELWDANYSLFDGGIL